MNILFGVLLVICTTSQWSGCSKSNDRFEPIEVFSFQTTKFQVKDVIDSIVEQDTLLSFQKLTDYMDTFIFERSFCLTRLNDLDSIKYFYYFSGDVRGWLTSTDSTLLIFSYLSINGITYDAKSIRKVESGKVEKILNIFYQRVIGPTTESIRSLDKYDIRIIDSLKMGRVEEKGIVCKAKEVCDTLLLKYIDAGKYTAIPLSKRISNR